MSITMIGLDTAMIRLPSPRCERSRKDRGIKRKLSRNDLIPFSRSKSYARSFWRRAARPHHWARVLTGLGHDVKLIAPEAVKPFVKEGKKNDAADARRRTSCRGGIPA